jgi:hypothetical protein
MHYMTAITERYCRNTCGPRWPKGMLIGGGKTRLVKGGCTLGEHGCYRDRDSVHQLTAGCYRHCTILYSTYCGSSADLLLHSPIHAHHPSVIVSDLSEKFGAFY